MTARRGKAAGRSRGAARDPMERFHDEWLGMVQPIDGLVVSKPALLDAQVARPDDRTLRDRFLAHVAVVDGAPRLTDLSAFLADLLELGPDRWIPGAALPDRFRLAVPDTGQLLAPTAVLARSADAPPDALLWELPPGLPLDARETVTGGWDYPPSAKFDRLLRHAGVAIGLISNGTHLRLMYAPHGASTGAITFPVAAMARADGRPILDALVMLLHRHRWWSVAPAAQLPALLAASREAQGRVTRALADQVLEALHVLLAGFEAAQGGATDGALATAYRDPDLGPDHVYAGLLTFMLRLVFVLYAEDNDLLPVDDDLYAEHLSVLALYEDLAADAGAYPDAMARRYGAYGRLLALFRAIYFGVSHGTLRMPPRHGELFSPHVYRFLEGNLEPAAPGPGDASGRKALEPPAIDDETVYRVLRGLLMLGDARLSYKALDVEQIGSVYENLMGYRVVELTSDAVCLKKSRAWVPGDDLAAEAPGARARWLQEEAGLAKADADRAAKATAGAKKAAAVLDALIECGAAAEDARATAGRFVIQPGPERRRSGSHYTPRSLTAPIVEKTLAPLIAALPRRKAGKGGPVADGPASEDLLSLKICDPAMGSGAFLVEAVRQLGDHVVEAWRREGRAGGLLPSHGPAHGAEDAVAQARRLVAQRCIYGVDRNPQAVTLAKLSLWLVTLAKDKPFTFVDHALRCGDSLVGLDINQITAFHWDAGKKGQQLDLIDREIRDVLEEAVEARERIVALAKDDSPEAQAEKLRLLRDAEDAVGRLRVIGDLVLGAFFSSVKDKEREAERVRRRDLVEGWLRSGGKMPAELAELAAEFRRRIPAFHWMIEMPEVFWVERPDPLDGGKRGGAAWIDGFVGNPPFMGGRLLQSSLGAEYQDWLFRCHGGSKNADFSAHFFRVSARLLGQHGTLGLVATNSISQTDTRETSLDPLTREGMVIYAANSSRKWPGDASVAYVVVHMARGRGAPAAKPNLDDKEVPHIAATLEGRLPRGEALRLSANDGLCHQGMVLLGDAFLLDADTRERLVAQEPYVVSVLPECFAGEDLTDAPIPFASRYLLDYEGLTEREIEQWPGLLSHAQATVKPQRAASKTAAGYPWWRLWRPRPELRAALSRVRHCYALSAVAKHLMIAVLPASARFTHSLFVFPSEDTGLFASLQSRVHEVWVRRPGQSTMEDRLRYSASDSFETFPLPALAGLRSEVCERLIARRAYFMAATWQGLTETYNCLKAPDYDGVIVRSRSSLPSGTAVERVLSEIPPGLVDSVKALAADPSLREAATRIEYVEHLRRLHEELDQAVLAAYGWNDIVVPPYLPPRPDDNAGKAARALFEDTIIDRLFALNAERAAAERLATPSAPNAPAAPKPKKPRKKSSPQPSLLDDEVD